MANKDVIERAKKFKKLYQSVMEPEEGTIFINLLDDLIAVAATAIEQSDAEYMDKELERYGYGTQNGHNAMIAALQEAILHTKEKKMLDVKVNK